MEHGVGGSSRELGRRSTGRTVSECSHPLRPPPVLTLPFFPQSFKSIRRNTKLTPKVVPSDAPFLPIPRSREVGQSYLTAIFTTLWAFLGAFRLVLTTRPKLLLVNGPGTCLPVAVAAVLLRLLCIVSTKIVFVESVCRVESLSLTGKILYHARLADAVHVQWKQLAEAYPRSKYVGILS